ncbi:hypothetical protein PHLCEN_2v1243 [Hermanssonia centrifuga]|uniref:Uncharacterized protein n=1 Tax=Hermanssonia centrifuga TaxID=98765 RepID=A0A2R6S3U6_9APHY|nr:hypothetical protein PHLCEN_2v1243 [Hermanssonia centrifuga]
MATAHNPTSKIIRLASRTANRRAKAEEKKKRADEFKDQNVLKQDPQCQEARLELSRVQEMYELTGSMEDDESDSDVVDICAGPLPGGSEEEEETDVASDSSDYAHHGNGPRGAPKVLAIWCGADQSVKELEALIPVLLPPRNGPRCLPRIKLIEQEVSRDNYSYKVSMKEERTYGQALPLYGRGRAKGKGRGRGRGNKHATVRRRVESDSEWDPDDEFDERCENFGFTRSEMNELLCQGVKPWDDDAWDVLDALNAF